MTNLDDGDQQTLKPAHWQVVARHSEQCVQRHQVLNIKQQVTSETKSELTDKLADKLLTCERTSKASGKPCGNPPIRRKNERTEKRAVW
jgi:hypothetical protein